MFSVVIPVYMNEENIPPLLEALRGVLREVPDSVELVFVIDGSPDGSFHRLRELLPKYEIPSHVIALSRNFGSFNAVRAGLESARGERYAVIAADLQEPPELLLSYEEVLRSGQADIVFGKRDSRNDPFVGKTLSRLYWALYRKFVLPEIPPGGLDTFACTKAVRDAVLGLQEANSSLVGMLMWAGFRRAYVDYERRARTVGTSAWSLKRKTKYFLDSVFGFTDLPIRLLMAVGGAGMLIAVGLGLLIIVARLLGGAVVSGYAALMTTILFFSTFHLFALGVLGSYLWRTFENTKARPNFIVASREHFDPGPPPGKR